MGVRRWVAALLVVPVLVSCSEDEPKAEPGPTDSSSVSETKTATGPVEPVMPEAAKKPTKAGAVAFVKHYWAMIDYAQATGETTGLTRLSNRSCDFCAGGTKGIQVVYAKGGRIRGEPLIVNTSGAVIRPFGDKHVAKVDAVVTATKSEQFYGDDDPRNKSFPGGTKTYEVLLVWAPPVGDWRVSKLVTS